MIPRIQPLRQVPSWQTSLAQCVSDPEELLQLLELGPEWLPGARTAADLFPLRVPRGYVKRMAKGDPHDPLLRQVLPLDQELSSPPEFVADPTGDLPAMVAPGVLHKYHGRVLLVTTGACAVHCRYCFRRHFPYAEANPAADQWNDAVAYLRGHPDVDEVILSGGDPLVLSDRRLQQLGEQLDAIPHLKRLRLHTRLPVVLPERITDDLLQWLRNSRLQPVLVMHVNHASELNAEVADACARLARHGVTLLNQAVLLRGVNDDPDSLVALSERLFKIGVIPYYLHLLDPVQGAAHFHVEPRQAQDLAAELSARLPGYLVPRLVNEVPGAPGKSALGF